MSELHHICTSYQCRCADAGLGVGVRNECACLPVDSESPLTRCVGCDSVLRAIDIETGEPITL